MPNIHIIYLFAFFSSSQWNAYAYVVILSFYFRNKNNVNHLWTNELRSACTWVVDKCSINPPQSSIYGLTRLLFSFFFVFYVKFVHSGRPHMIRNEKKPPKIVWMLNCHILGAFIQTCCEFVYGHIKILTECSKWKAIDAGRLSCQSHYRNLVLHRISD